MQGRSLELNFADKEQPIDRMRTTAALATRSKDHRQAVIEQSSIVTVS